MKIAIITDAWLPQTNGGRTHKEKKKRRDALAAAELLRDFLEEAGDEAERIDPPA